MKFPHPLSLLFVCVAVAACLTWILPAGQYDRHKDEATGRDVVTAGSYEATLPNPISPFDALVAIPKGMADAGSVIFFVFLIGGAFTAVDKTGALKSMVDVLVERSQGRGLLAVPVVAMLFATLGALENMQEEIIALIPVLLLLTRRLRLDPLVAVAMSAGAAAIGASFSPVNPFQVLIAQKLSQLSPGSGAGFRTAFLALAVAAWIAATLRYAHRMRVEAAQNGAEAEPSAPLNGRNFAILLTVAATFAVFVVGIMQFGWDFDQLSAPFVAMGIVAGLIGGLGVSGTAMAFAEGFASMATAAMLIGIARAISYVLDQGHVIDTLVHAMVTPLESLPSYASALGMLALHVGIHVPVPSVSGQAALTMPVLIPVGDLVHVSRQSVVLAYQYGAGLTDVVTPTNGGMMAVLAAAGVSYEKWIRFALPLFGGLLALGAVALSLAIATGF
ncbi:MAG: YfcC family protein [Vicinamibacteria bacterium]|nr:YfcC family protein [Vicinamibacteria bacterium]